MIDTVYQRLAHLRIREAQELDEVHLELGDGIEMFAMRLAGENILFEPLTGTLVSVDPEILDRCRHLRDADDPEFRNELRQCMTDAIGGGSMLPLKNALPKCESSWPTSLTLCLSSTCPLRCRYCYGSVGWDGLVMANECAFAAIRLVFGRSHGKEADPIINFSGTGEPTHTWRLLTECVDYATNLASEYGVRPKFLLNTNGYVSVRQAEYLAKQFSGVCLSLDGPERIHDRNRVTRTAKGSFNRVFRTAKILVDAGIGVIFRPTITGESVHDILEIVEFLGTNFPGQRVDLEPVNLRGRSIAEEVPAPTDEEYCAAYFEACAIAPRFKLEVVYLGVGDLRERKADFCGVTVPNFCVLPDGKVTGCYGYSANDDLAREFEYGTFERSSGTFTLDAGRISTLRGLTMTNDATCRSCFCRWQCSGGCPARRIEKGGEQDLVQSYLVGKARCDLHRALVLNDLSNIMNC